MMLLVSYLFLLWLFLVRFSVFWSCSLAGRLFWYLFIVVAFGRKFVLFLFFLVFIVALSGRFFLVPIFLVLIVSASGGKFVLVPIFLASIVAASGGKFFQFLFF